jgi:hypothetical protein
MEGSVLSFLKAEWKVSDTDSAHWASSFYMPVFKTGIWYTNVWLKFQFFIPELWDFIHQIVGDFSYVAL